MLLVIAPHCVSCLGSDRKCFFYCSDIEDLCFQVAVLRLSVWKSSLELLETPIRIALEPLREAAKMTCWVLQGEIKRASAAFEAAQRSSCRKVRASRLSGVIRMHGKFRVPQKMTGA